MSDIESTSRRRTFKKSFAGCSECRRRKVKCDEIHPICGRCEKHFRNPRPCDWANRPCLPSSTVRKRSLPSSPSPNPYSSLTPHIPTAFKSRGPNNITLRLFHHYMTSVSTILPQAHNPNIRAMWTIDAPQISFDCEYLLNSLLSISALHLHHTRAPSDNTLFTAVRYYFDKAISSFQNELSTLNKRNSEPVVITATLLTLLGGPIDRNFMGSLDQSSYHLPLFTIKVVQAFSQLRYRVTPLLKGSNLMPMFEEWAASGGMENLPHYRLLQEDERTNLDVLLDCLDPGSQEYEMYNSALKHVRILQEACVVGEPTPALQRKIARFALYISPEFLECIEQHDPRALVIIAHHFALASVLDHVWTMRRMPKYHVEGVGNLLPAEWKGMMAWPERVVKKRGEPYQSVPWFNIEEMEE